MFQSERRSLLNREISRREATARDVLNEFLTTLVKAFDFQIQEIANESTDAQQPTKPLDTELRHTLTRPTAGGGERHAYVDICTPDVVLSLPPSPSSRQDPTGERTMDSAYFLRKLNAKLTELVLNESIEHAASENAVELGWRKRSSLSGEPTTRTSLLDDLRSLTYRVTRLSANSQRSRDDDDEHFQTDDECSSGSHYQIMT